MFDINNVIAPTRRETLLNVLNIMEDDNKLEEAAGKCALLDVTMMLLSDTSDDLRDRFDKQLSRVDLEADIEHIGNHHKIHQQLEKRREKYARICG